MKNSNKNLLYYIYCALGEKSGKNNKEADKIAFVRLLMFLSIFITNCFIVANAIRHWNDEMKIEVFVETSSSPEYQTSPMKVSNRTLESE